MRRLTTAQAVPDEVIERTSAEKNLLIFVREAKQTTLVDFLDEASPWELQLIHDEFAPEEVGEEKAFYLPEFVLLALEKLLNREPKFLPARDSNLTQDGRAVVLAQRYAAGEALWNPRDRIHESPASRVNDRFEREAFTRAGWKKAGCPDGLEELPPANGDTVTGELLMRDCRPPVSAN